MSAPSSSELASDKDKMNAPPIQDEEKRESEGSIGGEKGVAQNGNEGQNTVTETPARAPAPGPPGFFSWARPAIRNQRLLKTWLRCILASAGAMILLVDKVTLNTMGQAGFFAAIVSVLLPPSLALSVFLMASVTLLFGMLIGWAWGAATMAAGLHVQDKALLAARLVAAEKGFVAGISPTVQLQTLVFKGAFLDVRTSAVYGAMFFIGTFAMGVLRARLPKLALMGIFGTIVMDVFSTYGPLFPTAQYTLAKMFLIPTCYYLAIAIASLILIFPETLNHMWLTTLDRAFFGSALSLLSLQSTALGTPPSDHAAWDALAGKISAARTAFGGALTALTAQVALIDLEFSVGRLGPGDLKRLAPELRAVGLRASGLLAFQAAVTTAQREDARADAALADAEARLKEQKEGNFNPAAHSRFAHRRAKIREREARHGHDLDALVPILAQVAQPLRASAEEGMGALRAWFAGVQCREVESLFICFVFCDTLDAFAARVHRVLTIVADLDLRRPKPRLWFPPGFGKLGRRLLSREPANLDEQPLAMGTASDPTKFEDETNVSTVGDDAEEEKPVQRAYCISLNVLNVSIIILVARNPDARAPTSTLGRFSVALGGALRFFKTPEGIFALRHAVVSLALWVPAVVPRTAWFYYSEKGLWALIMAQMGLATFAGDQLFGLATRLVGTAVGLLNGMVVWYIAAPGMKDGNAYAVVIVTAVFNSPYIFARIASPPAQMMIWTMIGVTTVFVVGYSWLDTHFPLLSNSGVGIHLGWKRALLVMIGFTAGGIVMLFPRPTSSRTLVRRTLAAILREQGSIFGKEVEAFLAEEARARSGHFEKETIDWVDQFATGEDEPKVSPKEKRIWTVAHRVVVVFERLQALAPSLKMARWEPQVQGLWPHEQYELLHMKQTKLITTLSLIAGAFSKLDPKWCSILVHRTPFLNPNLLSDIFATIDILTNALEGGAPAPPHLSPCLRERLVYHETLIRSMKRNANARQVAVTHPVEDSDSDVTDSDTHTEFVAGKVEGASIGFEALSLSVLMDEQLPTHSTAVVALGAFLALIDEIGAIVRELCGQTTFRGFDALHHEFLEREEAAIGTLGQK
ncbi:hypothetical protein MSAN_00834300 [Mycena sanguinolenta]|uniref:ER transporter 6TM N-terminal domain-containing protein n=1 Tax=Mycena sanguinolenta TaxID=230812 RepID=A0A8H7DAV8_9AGAR|nr:hypothetical protein MSAN_00834300 [Mycena sanguinolenta]